MHVRILGSAAGGGFPQWNCHCDTCEAAREGVRAQPRTQSSLAIRGADGPWFLVNASPDARQQLETLAPDGRDDSRAGPVAGVLLTDAEIDHTAGLLLLRESAVPVRVYGDAGVELALRQGFPVLTMLERYCGLRMEHARPRDRNRSWTDRACRSNRSRSAATHRATWTDPASNCEASGMVFRDRATGAVVTYVPGLARFDDEIRDRFAASDLVLVDGTFWTDDELPRLGFSERGAHDMGHLPLSGPGGTIEALSALPRPRKVLVHINNTNPILLDDSPAASRRHGCGHRNRV